MNRRQFDALEPFARRQILSCVRSHSTLADVFHENTKLTRSNVSAYIANINAVLRQPQLLHLMKHADKVYSLVDETIALPDLTPNDTLERAIASRRSRRTYSGSAMPLDVLARLLHFSYGRTARPPAPAHFRAAPSGGALYPLEIYVVGLRINGAPAGLYHYKPSANSIEVVRTGNLLEQMKTVLFLEGVDIDNAAVVIVVTGILERNYLKYQDRGYRMVLIEAGGVAQNISLVATQQGFGCVWLGGFYDDELSAELGADPVSEPIILAGVVGRL
jgi:SagB-type dehydrogenase family enzyme